MGLYLRPPPTTITLGAMICDVEDKEEKTARKGEKREIGMGVYRGMEKRKGRDGEEEEEEEREAESDRGSTLEVLKA